MLFGVNPWRLQSWLGHKRIDETMIYVHVAENHRRAIPEPILEAAKAEQDPDNRILAMLGARGANAPQAEVVAPQAQVARGANAPRDSEGEVVALMAPTSPLGIRGANVAQDTSDGTKPKRFQSVK